MVPRFGGKSRLGLPETASEWPRYLRAKAIGWLARREYTSAELAAKLGRLTPENALVEAVLADLRSHDLLSDTRFAESFVRSRSTRFGSARVAGELRAKGVPVDQAKGLIDGLKADELARARLVGTQVRRGGGGFGGPREANALPAGARISVRGDPSRRPACSRGSGFVRLRGRIFRGPLC